MIDIQAMLRPHLRTLKPYSSARDEFSGEGEVFLDANENPFESISGGNVNRYPDPYQWKIKEKLSSLKGVNRNQIFLGNGSDEAIDLLIRAFCEPGKDHVMLLPPTYGMYGVSADINGVEKRLVELTADFQIQIDEVVRQINEQTKLIFICSPNNPTGNCIEIEAIIELLNNSKGLVILDEAYIDFVEHKSWVPILKHWPNLVILQTFSKAWGMAGLRLGMAFAHPSIIQILNKIKPPYNINTLTQDAALAALENAEKKNEVVERILVQRNYLLNELREIPSIQHLYPSDANFILMKLPNATVIYEKLIQQKIIVRNRSTVILCEDCLRITVGTESENELLLSALKELTS